MSLFEVDRHGLRNQIAKRGKARVLGELLQNAWDAIGVQNVSLTLTAIAARPQAHLSRDPFDIG